MQSRHVERGNPQLAGGSGQRCRPRHISAGSPLPGGMSLDPAIFTDKPCTRVGQWRRGIAHPPPRCPRIPLVTCRQTGSVSRRYWSPGHRACHSQVKQGTGRVTHLITQSVGGPTIRARIFSHGSRCRGHQCPVAAPSTPAHLLLPSRRNRVLQHVPRRWPVTTVHVNTDAKYSAAVPRSHRGHRGHRGHRDRSCTLTPPRSPPPPSLHFSTTTHI